MKKIWLKTSAVSFGILALLTIITSNSIVFASSVQDLQTKKENIQDNRTELESEIKKAEEKLNNLKSEQNTINEEIKQIDMATSKINQDLRKKSEEITNLKKNIDKLNKEIKELQERIKQREELLKQRARSYQETGTISYLDVLIGANDFADFIERIGAVTTIVNADKELINQHIEDKKALESKQIEVEEKLEKLKQYVEQQEKWKNELELQKKEKDSIMATLKSEENDIENEKLNLEEEKLLLTAQEDAIKKAITLEKTKKVESKNTQQSITQKNSNSSSNSTGDWTKPAQGRLTSVIGERWNKYHAGIDIANSSDVPIVAAAEGVVSRSYYSSSYGNVVFISHSINGQVYTTVYAHMDNRDVQAGQSVSKGQQIGIMGNTGQSFGQHLHFEMHKGEWNAAKSNAINPLDYISM